MIFFYKSDTDLITGTQLYGQEQRSVSTYGSIRKQPVSMMQWMLFQAVEPERT